MWHLHNLAGLPSPAYFGLKMSNAALAAMKKRRISAAPFHYQTYILSQP